jgi:hypothetical protein
MFEIEYDAEWIAEKYKHRRSTKRSRMIKRKKKLRRLFDPKRSYAVLWHGDWENPNGWLTLKSYGCNRVRFYKKYSNRKVRRYKGEIGNGNHYRKIFDYWWTLY